VYAYENDVAVHCQSNAKNLLGQERSTLLEIFQYPGFEEHTVTPLPFNVSLQTQVMQHILPKRYVRHEQVLHTSYSTLFIVIRAHVLSNIL
jgi:homoserine kinase